MAHQVDKVAGVILGSWAASRCVRVESCSPFLLVFPTWAVLFVSHEFSCCVES